MKPNSLEEKIEAALMTTGRVGIDGLCEWLHWSDFYQAPASSCKHLAKEGGLALHSWTVYEEMLAQQKSLQMPVSAESIAIAGLLHDACKIDLYKKQEDGTYIHDAAQIRLDHGVASLYKIQRHILLEAEEAVAIRWHMGAWATAGESQRRMLNDAFEDNALLRLLVIADQIAVMRETIPDYAKELSETIRKTNFPSEPTPHPPGRGK